MVNTLKLKFVSALLIVVGAQAMHSIAVQNLTILRHLADISSASERPKLIKL